MSQNAPAPDRGQVFPMLTRALSGRTLTARRAAGVISIVTVVLTVASGVVIWLVDDGFSSLGQGLWWAVQTLTTVGYGDVVPESTAGKLIATVVMLNGIALLTVITAAVTATLIDQVRRRREPEGNDERPLDPAIVGALDDIRSRLETIEAAVSAIQRDRR